MTITFDENDIEEYRPDVGRRFADRNKKELLQRGKEMLEDCSRMFSDVSVTNRIWVTSFSEIIGCIGVDNPRQFNSTALSEWLYRIQKFVPPIKPWRQQMVAVSESSSSSSSSSSASEDYGIIFDIFII